MLCLNVLEQENIWWQVIASKLNYIRNIAMAILFHKVGQQLGSHNIKIYMDELIRINVQVIAPS